MTRTLKTFLGIAEKMKEKGRDSGMKHVKGNAGVVTARLLVFLSCNPESVTSAFAFLFCPGMAPPTSQQLFLYLSISF